MNNVKIIAEIGINHDGEEKKAMELIYAAERAGTHAIKFQYRNINNAYSESAKEIGDEILLTEIKRTYLSPQQIIGLAEISKNKGMETGISFFDEKDILDFGEKISLFDFFKIPSVELTNKSLIDALLSLERHLYISIGAHTESEIEAAFSRLPAKDWTPMHCISNYPLTLQNPRLGYLQYLQDKWNKDVGYSSHDENWEVCILAMQLGAKVIERHITLDRQSEGLDHSSSSTPDHFEKISNFANNLALIMSGNGPRVPNQGELLNRQNLGRSFFAKNSYPKNHLLKKSDLIYCSPNIGINKTNVKKYLSKPLQRAIKASDSITDSIFQKQLILPDKVIEFARDTRLSLPVRVHDLANIQQLFPIGSFEFHLSYREVLSTIDLDDISPTDRYSIHIPDYINSTQLIDPFSEDVDQKTGSIEILDRTVMLAEQLQDLTGSAVPVVGSFSIIHSTREDYFEEYSSLLKSYLPRGVQVVPQWLPPIAWYFGGSVSLHVMNEVQDAVFLKDYNIGVCLDVCHMILGRNFYQFSTDSIMKTLKDQVKHIHIADAAGIDGEGLAIGNGEPENISLIKKSLNYQCMKVIEVWQGHFDNGAGFRKALFKLAEIHDYGK